MRPGLMIFLVLVCSLVGLATTLAFELSFERVLLLAPVIVVGGAAIAGLTLVWTRALAESVRSSRRRG